MLIKEEESENKKKVKVQAARAKKFRVNSQMIKVDEAVDPMTPFDDFTPTPSCWEHQTKGACDFTFSQLDNSHSIPLFKQK